jgi:hypothetical protein
VRVHLLPGIHTEPVSPVEQLIPYLKAAGLAIAWVDYGYILGLETRLANPIVWRTIFPYIDKGDICVAHSNGCAIGYDLMNAGAPFAGAAFINGALDPRITRPVGVKWIDVYFNAGDVVTEVAGLAQELGVVDPTWGAMGHLGYQGHDPSITNINCGGTVGLPTVWGHSDFFSPLKVKAWGPYLANRIKATLPVAPVTLNV